MEQLSGQDASFVYMETRTTPMHIGSCAIYDPSTASGGFVRFKDILRFIESRLDSARAFRQRLVRAPLDVDHPYWIEDPEFDLEYHVRHFALPKPGDWRQLCILTSRLHARPLDMEKPLWEFNVVEGLDNIEGIPKGSFAVISKVHHAAIDGMSGVEMAAAVHDLTPDIPDRPAGKPWKPENMPNVAELLARSYVNNLTQPLRVVETIGRTLPGIARLGREISKGEISLKGARTAPKTLLNAKVSPHRVFDAAMFPLKDIRAIKDTVPGATVNDVILSIVGGGLRKYLKSRGDLPKSTMNAMAPISVRSEGEKKAMGNQVSAMIVALGTHIEDPVTRLEFVHEQAQNSKAMTNAIGARTLADYNKLMPAGISGIAARLYTRMGVANAHSPAFNCVVTNIPGSPIPLYFAGAEMVATYSLGPVFDGMGLINAVYSYRGTIGISFTSDRDMMPDPENYAAAMQETFEELKKATLGTTAKNPGARSKAKPAAKSTATKSKAKAKPKAAAKTKPRNAAARKKAPATKKAG